MGKCKLKERFRFVRDHNALLLKPEREIVKVCRRTVTLHAPAADREPGDDLRGSAQFENQAGKQNLRHKQNRGNRHRPVRVGKKRGDKESHSGRRDSGQKGGGQQLKKRTEQYSFLRQTNHCAEHARDQHTLDQAQDAENNDLGGYIRAQ